MNARAFRQQKPLGDRIAHNPSARYDGLTMTNAADIDLVRPPHERFQELLAAWRAETGLVQNPSQLVIHPRSLDLMAYRDAIALMIDELKIRPGRLVFLLSHMTNQRPYGEIKPGDIRAMSSCWVEWFEAQRNAAE